MEAVANIRDGIGETAELMGVLLALCDYRLNATKEIIRLIRGHYGKQVFKTEIKGNVRLKEAPLLERRFSIMIPAPPVRNVTGRLLKNLQI